MAEKMNTVAAISKNFHAEHRGNCAMSVAYGYARATGKSEAEAVAAAEMFRAFGGGKAPNGACGALYAAAAWSLRARHSTF